MISRRSLISGTVMTAASTALFAHAKSYGSILGANDRLNVAIVGTNSRALAHLSGLQANAATTRVTHLCDVDSRNLNAFAQKASHALGYSSATTKDFREVLAARDVDVVTIATPDHWHAPMAILALKAHKHVYVEKPSSHNPREGELLVAAQKKYGKLVQVGNQHRSCTHERMMIEKIHQGLLGRTYAATAWYSNTRASMGVGKVVAVPAELDWELWQGPAPRSAYKDNIHPYNWHWLRRYGTGEALNNGTHETDVCRWALDVAMPKGVNAIGGRYQFHDDWEFYDTLNVSFQYDDKVLNWNGRSDQGMKLYGRDRGALIQGERGSVVLAADGYEVYDWKGNKTDQYQLKKAASSSDLLSQDEMTNLHFANLVAGIRNGDPLHSAISEINISITALQLANIAYFTDRSLKVDPTTGHVRNDSEAMALWKRSYEPGWEPTL